MRLRKTSIEIKTTRQIELMREAGRLTGETLVAVGEIIRPGISTDEIDHFVHEDTLRLGCTPAPLNYKGFPKSVCTSINEVVCHGIPEARNLEDGDIINVDVTHIYKNYHGDSSLTFYVGTPSEEGRLVTETAREALKIGMEQVRPGGRVGDIGAAIQEFVEGRGLSVVRDFAGHGIGKKFHTDPIVSHFGSYGQGAKFRPGMTFTIEPMVNIGGWEVRVLGDGWTAVTLDGSLSAQFEHTLLVTEDGHEVLTQRSAPVLNSEIFPQDQTSSTSDSL